MNLKEELPAEGLTVTFLDKFTDITKEFEKIVKKSKGNDSIVKVKYNELIENATKGGSEERRVGKECRCRWSQDH